MIKKEDNKDVNIETIPIKKLTKYLKESSASITKNDIRFIIQAYYQIQEYRIGLAGQIRSINKSTDGGGDDAPQHELLDWLFSNMYQLEDEIKKAVDIYTDNQPVGAWLKQIMGIGPILAGGLLSSFDVTKASSVSHYYSYAGLNDNNVPWLGKAESEKIVKQIVTSKSITDEELFKLAKATNRKFECLVKFSLNDKGKRNKECLIKNLSKPPYNTDLKKLCWKIGESFIKVSNKDSSLYGRLYKERRQYETENNEKFLYKDQAESKLLKYNISKNTDAYKSYSIGQLPPAHIISRAKRHTLKIFLSHLYDEMYKQEYNKLPVRAYVFEYLNHVDQIAPEVPGIIIK